MRSSNGSTAGRPKRRSSKALRAQQLRTRRSIAEHWQNSSAKTDQSQAARSRQETKSATRCRASCAERERGIEGPPAVLRLLGESSTLKNQLAQIDQYLVGIERDIARIDARRRRPRQRPRAPRQRRKRSCREALGTADGARVRSTSADTRRGGAGERARRGDRARARKLEELRGETSRLKARRDSLDEILSHRAYTTESVKRLFTAVEKGQAAGFQARSACWPTSSRWTRQYEKATEEFLHEELEYVVVKDWEQAERGHRPHARRHRWPGYLSGPSRGARDEHWPACRSTASARRPASSARLSDVLRLTNGLDDRAADLLPRLARCFLAEDRAAAQRLALQYPDLYFLLPDGICYHGHAVSGGKKRAAVRWR